MKESNLPLFPLIRSKNNLIGFFFISFALSHFGFSFLESKAGMKRL